MVKSLWSDDSGASAVEYGLIAGLVAIAIIGAATLLGAELGNLFGRITNTLQGSVPN